MIERWLGPPWLWLALYGAILGVALWFSVPAHADPVDTYTAASWRAVCETLDEIPSVGGVVGVIEGVQHDSGFTPFDAGRVVAQAVYDHCPRHAGLLAQFVNLYGKGQAV